MGKWVSCCIMVEGIQQNIFVLKWEKQAEQDAFPFVIWCRYCSVHMPFMPIHERRVCIYPFSLLSFLNQNIQTSSPSEQSCLPGVPKTTQTGKHAAAA